MKRYIIGILIGAVIGWLLHPSPSVVTKTEVRVDTIVYHDVVHDTVWRAHTIVRELPVHHYHTDTMEVCRTDSVYVEVPISTYRFSDSLYYAEVSGYEVTLDRMEVFARHTRETVVKRPHWALTAGVGAGVDYGGNIRPYVGVQIGYVLWSH